MAPRKLPGIFCLEGEWDGDLRARRSVEPLLELLEKLSIAKTIRRDVATREEFAYYLKKWGQARYADYPVLYIATHGEPGEFDLGKDRVSLEELADMLGTAAKGRVIYFGTCLTLAQYDEDLTTFVKRTGAKAVVGYATEVDWLEAAAFELLLLERLSRGSRTDAFFRHLVRDHGKFAESLGLVVATKTAVLDAEVPQ